MECSSILIFRQRTSLQRPEQASTLDSQGQLAKIFRFTNFKNNNIEEYFPQIYFQILTTISKMIEIFSSNIFPAWSYVHRAIPLHSVEVRPSTIHAVERPITTLPSMLSHDQVHMKYVLKFVIKGAVTSK